MCPIEPVGDPDDGLDDPVLRSQDASGDAKADRDGAGAEHVADHTRLLAVDARAVLP